MKSKVSTGLWWQSLKMQHKTEREFILCLKIVARGELGLQNHWVPSEL